MIVRPQFLVMDSATLGKVSRDFFGDAVEKRQKAQSLVKRLSELGVYVAFPMTNLIEVFRHADDTVFRNRFKFFSKLPLIAWVQNHNGSRGPGSVVELLKGELDSFVRKPKEGWNPIVDSVRDQVWQTGTGDELFNDPDHEFWLNFRQEVLWSADEERAAASIAQTDPGHLGKTKLKDIWASPTRTATGRSVYKQEFESNLRSQLAVGADKKLTSSANLASEYADNIFDEIEAAARSGVDLRKWLSDQHGVPQSMVDGEMTVNQLGLLAVVVRKLQIISESLGIDVDLETVPPDALPTLFLHQELWHIQSGAKVRAEGSNFGDNNLAAFAMYADHLEVDSRTFEYLNQLQRRDSRFQTLFKNYFRSPDYASIPDKLAAASNVN